MGIRAAYSMWATATLRTVESGVLEPAEADALLDELEEATLTLLDLAILTDHRFIDRRVTPLRS